MAKKSSKPKLTTLEQRVLAVYCDSRRPLKMADAHAETGGRFITNPSPRVWDRALDRLVKLGNVEAVKPRRRSRA
jgi:hypothetical protein